MAAGLLQGLLLPKERGLGTPAQETNGGSPFVAATAAVKKGPETNRVPGDFPGFPGNPFGPVWGLFGPFWAPGTPEPDAPWPEDSIRTIIVQIRWVLTHFRALFRFWTPHRLP